VKFDAESPCDFENGREAGISTENRGQSAIADESRESDVRFGFNACPLASAGCDLPYAVQDFLQPSRLASNMARVLAVRFLLN
jgi:hypothetical protein